MHQQVVAQIAKLLAAQQQPPQKQHLSFTLGRIIHNTFVCGVAEMQYKRMLHKLASNKAWDNVGTSACFHAASDLASLCLPGHPFDAVCRISSSSSSTPPIGCHVFEHKCWRFVLGVASMPHDIAQPVDRDDDRTNTHQVQVQLIINSNAGDLPTAYIAESGLLLVQDLCDMCSKKQGQGCS
jgi:hypothetical protein